HVAADDVHLFGMRRADLRAIHRVARTWRRRLRVQLTERFVRLRHRIGVDAGAPPDAARLSAALREAGRVPTTASAGAGIRGRRVIAPLGAYRGREPEDESARSRDEPNRSHRVSSAAEV